MKRLVLTILLIAVAISFAGEPWRLTVMFNNDRHGGMAPGEATFMNPETPPPLEKLPAEARLIGKYREIAKENNEGFLYLDQGDVYQGAPVGSLTRGEAIVVAYNTFMPDAVTVGNHEFDDGMDNFLSMLESSDFTWLGANLIDVETDQIIEGLEPYIIREFDMGNGKMLKVGIIGVTTKDTKTMSFPENTAGFKILDEAETANRYAKELREEHRVDFVIVSSHIGLPFDAMEAYQATAEIGAEHDEGHYGGMDQVELASKVEGVDVIFGGHIHVGYHRPWEDPRTHTLVFQNYAHGTGVGAIRFKFDPETKIFMGYETLAKDDALVTLFGDEFWPDPEMAQLVDSLQKDAEKGLAEVVGEADGMLNRGGAQSNRVGHLVCDAMIDATGADVSTTNMGGVRAEIGAGPITRADVFNVMPFDNKVVVVPLTGQEIVEVIQRLAGKYTGALAGGIEVVYLTEEGAVQSMTIGGEPVDSAKTYKLATTDYLYYSYGIPQLEAVPKSKVEYTGMLLRDAIERYIKKISPVSPKVDDRWKNIEE